MVDWQHVKTDQARLWSDQKERIDCTVGDLVGFQENFAKTTGKPPYRSTYCDAA